MTLGGSFFLPLFLFAAAPRTIFSLCFRALFGRVAQLNFGNHKPRLSNGRRLALFLVVGDTITGFSRHEVSVQQQVW